MVRSTLILFVNAFFPHLHRPSLGQLGLKDLVAMNFKMVIYRIPSRVGRSMGQPANAQLFDHEVRLGNRISRSIFMTELRQHA